MPVALNAETVYNDKCKLNCHLNVLKENSTSQKQHNTIFSNYSNQYHPRLIYLIHKPACMKAQAIKEHLFAEDVHFFNSDEQRNCTGSNNRAEK